MKKLLIGSLVGAILLFGWQSLSWTVFHIHEKAYQYTASQDTLLSAISNTLKTEGQYMLPRTPPDAPYEDMEKLGKQMEGKPWAVVTFHSYYPYDMITPIVRGFLTAFVCVFLVCLVVMKTGRKSFNSIFTTVLTFGVICFLFVWLNAEGWFHTSWDVLKGELIDDLMGWGLTGIWLGLWYSRR
ncbi:MAG: hypothetical protein ABIQ07_11215 [Ginsengibacter sp.]